MIGALKDAEFESGKDWGHGAAEVNGGRADDEIVIVRDVGCHGSSPATNAAERPNKLQSFRACFDTDVITGWSHSYII